MNGNWARDTAIFFTDEVGNDASVDGGICGEMTLYGFRETKKHYTVADYAFGGSGNHLFRVFMGGRYVTNTTAISAIKFHFSSGNIASGSIAMYGVRDA